MRSDGHLPPDPGHGPGHGHLDADAAQELQCSVLNALSAAVTVVDADGLVVAMNDTWSDGRADTFGAGSRPTLSYGRLCADHVGIAQAPRLTSLVSGVLRGEVDRVDEDLDLGDAHGTRWLHVEVRAHTDRRGRRTALVTHTDITRHRENDASVPARLQGRVDLESGLRQAIARDELHLAYQPVVDLGTGDVVSVEALVRWIRPRRGVVDTDRFVAVAEDAGLIAEIGRWVLQQAIAQTIAWERDGLEVTVAVNVSAQQLVPGFTDEVRGLLTAHGLPANRLVLEVTESALMTGPASGPQVLAELRAAGCRIAMDDFGTGHTSLGSLKSLPVHVVKLDSSFVAGVADRNSADNRIVAAVLALADALGLFVVAEGVETVEQAEELTRLGCGFGQGFLFSPPRDRLAMTEYLRASRGRDRVAASA